MLNSKIVGVLAIFGFTCIAGEAWAVDQCAFNADKIVTNTSYCQSNRVLDQGRPTQTQDGKYSVESGYKCGLTGGWVYINNGVWGCGGCPAGTVRSTANNYDYLCQTPN